MKNLFKRTTIKHEVLEKIREVNSREISFDTKRYVVSAWLENYYKAGDGRKKDSKELIQRLSEIEKDHGFKEMLWAALLGALFALFTEGVILLSKNTAIVPELGWLIIVVLGIFIVVVALLALLVLLGIAAVAKDYYSVNEYDQMHLESEEKELIEGILKERFEKTRAAYAVRKVHVRKEPPTNDQKIELIKVYHEEWQFRQGHVWEKFVLFVVVIFFASTMPITVGFFPGVEIPEKLSLYWFPVLGIILTFFFLASNLADAARMSTLDTLIRKIVGDVYPAKYNKKGLDPLLGKNKNRWNPFNMRMSVWFPILVAVVEIAIAVGVIVLIHNGGL